MKKIAHCSQNSQQGIALIMALIMLLLITIIGVTSVRMTSVDTQISGNSMFSLMVFQGAESALGKVASNNDLSNIRDAASRSTTPIQVPDTYFTPVEIVNGGSKLTSSAKMIYENNFKGPLFTEIPSSIDFEYQIFRTTAESRLQATAAKAVHIEGVAVSKATP